MADLFWSYWDATIRFALLATVLLVLTPLLKRMVTPRLLCWAWAILLLRLVLPFSLPFSGSIFNAHEKLQPSTWTETIRRGVVNAGIGETIIPALRDEDQKIIDSRIPISWETALMALWLAGVAFMSIRLLKNVSELSRFFAAATRYDNGSLYRLFKDTRQRMGIYANVPLLVSDDVKTPGIAGVFNPRIVIPQRCAAELSEQELRCVFMHELTHYRRGDLFLHHALLLLCYLHWYNPLAWLVLKQFKDEMEKACDLEVVDSVCVRSPQEYGYTLLQVLRFSRGAHYAPGGALSLLGSRKSGALKERIQLIASSRRKRPCLAFAGMAIFGTSFVFAMTGEIDQRKEAERLVKLTRIAGPFGFEREDSDELGRTENQQPFEFALSEERREWTQVMNASRFKGNRLTVRAQLRFDDRFGSIVISASANDVNDFKLAHDAIDFSAVASERDFSIEFEVPKNAAKLRYGLSFRGIGTAWVEELEFELVDESDTTVE